MKPVIFELPLLPGTICFLFKNDNIKLGRLRVISSTKLGAVFLFHSAQLGLRYCYNDDIQNATRNIRL